MPKQCKENSARAQVIVSLYATCFLEWVLTLCEFLSLLASIASRKAPIIGVAELRFRIIPFQPYGKRGALAHFALNGNFTLMKIDEVFA